jgi:hypothetical protein
LTPYRFVFSNTIASNVAAAECALAVRAAQRRPSSNKVKRSLKVPGHACSAFKQHARKMRERGAVLQQRHPPPALRLLAEALLPVQLLPLLKHALRLIQFRPQEMAPRRDALREIHDAVFALQGAHAPQQQQQGATGHGIQTLTRAHGIAYNDAWGEFHAIERSCPSS